MALLKHFICVSDILQRRRWPDEASEMAASSTL